MKPALCAEEHCMIRYPKVISRHVGRYSRKLMIEITSAYAREGTTTKILRFPGKASNQRPLECLLDALTVTVELQ